MFVVCYLVVGSSVCFGLVVGFRCFDALRGCVVMLAGCFCVWGFCGSCGCGCGLLWMIAFGRWVGVAIVLVVCGDLRFVG